MSDFLTSVPVQIINAATPLQSFIFVFMATTLGGLTIAGTTLYLYVRKIEHKGIFAPFENLAERSYDFCIVALSCVGTYISTIVLKSYFQILRPAVLNGDLRALIEKTDYGFPSGHASFYAALATAIFFINKKAGIVLGIIALLVGAGRILVGVHTPLDVIGGFLLGTSFSAIIAFLAQSIEKKSKK